MIRPFRFACLAAVFAIVSSPAFAQQPEPQVSATDAEARALFEAGRIAFDNGRFPQALEMFQRSYELSGRSALLYNIGAAFDRLHRDRDALEAFEQYLASDRDSVFGADVEVRVAMLRERVAAADALAPRNVAVITLTPEAPQTIVAVPSARTRRSELTERTPIARRWWFWTVIGVLAAGSAIGVGVAVANPGAEGPTTINTSTAIIRL